MANGKREASLPSDRIVQAQLRRAARERWLQARKAEITYARQLSSVARNVGQLVRGFASKHGELSAASLAELQESLKGYARALRPWARAVAGKMQSDVGRRDRKSWIELSRELGAKLRSDIDTAPVGVALRTALDESVDLITSIPLEAGERVHKLTVENMITGQRAATLHRMILASGDVSLSRARTIARTETARTASLLTETRAKHIGCEGYWWRTTGDQDVRKEHKRLDGAYIKWSAPPIADDSSGVRAHAGQIYNCRCWPEPVIPDELFL